VYVNVSKRFINPGIDMLGRLSGRSMTQAQANFAELVEWEREAVGEIARLAVEVSLSPSCLSTRSHSHERSAGAFVYVQQHSMEADCYPD
jgi:hypothetical protein